MAGRTGRRFPKVLADELSAALAAVRDMDQDFVTELLARYRRNMVKCIATWGLTNMGSPVDGLEQIPLEHYRKIEKLDDAFQKLHHYRDGGAIDYVAKDVANEVSRGRALLPRQRSRKADDEAVAEHLRQRRYSESENQKELILEAMEKFGISERKVRGIASTAGMTKAKKKN